MHGQPFTLPGSGFDISNTTIVVRDLGNAPVGTVDLQWSLSYPSALSGNNNLQNQLPNFRGLGSPHPYVNGVLAGCHLDSSNPSNEVEAVASFTQPLSYPYPTYASWYTLADPTSAFANGSPLDYNFKYYNFAHGVHGEGEQTALTQYYLSFQAGGPADNTVVSRSTIFERYTNSTGIIQDPDVNGHSHFWGAAPCHAHAANGWIKQIFTQGITPTTGNNGGYVNQTDIAADGTIYNPVFYVEATDSLAGDTSPKRSISWGSYWRSRGVNNFRLAADFYIAFGGGGDKSCAMVFLCDTNTWATAKIREPQISTSWADGSIASTCHKGKHANGSQVYALVQLRSQLPGVGMLVRGPFTMN